MNFANKTKETHIVDLCIHALSAEIKVVLSYNESKKMNCDRIEQQTKTMNRLLSILICYCLQLEVQCSECVQ